jgi:hypothetical protein
MAEGPTSLLRSLFDAVRRRLRLRGLLLRLAWFLALLVLSLVVLLFLAGAIGPSPVWRPLCGAWLCGAAVLLCAAALKGRLQGRLSDEAVARYIGERAPDLRSDLLSAIQLGEKQGHREAAYTSPALIDELCRRTAAACGTLPPQRLVELRPAYSLLSLPLLLLLLFALFAPGHLLRGARTLLAPPPDPTRRSSEPLVGDLRLLYTYPRYSGLPQRTIPGSSGEVLALAGTAVRVEARALLPVERAQLVIETEDQPPVTRPVQIVRGEAERKAGAAHPLLLSSFVVQRPGRYTFVIEQAQGVRVREAEGHRIEVEADRPPRIDLFVPAEDLEISGTRRVELAYSAEDDLGLGEIDLVWSTGGGPERRKRIRSLGPPDAPGKDPKGGRIAQPIARTAAAKIEWDLAELDLQPGARVAYFVEARDLNDVTGPGVGRSRSYSLRISSPREKHEATLAKHEALREQALQLLGDRLELGRLDRDARDGRDGAEFPERLADAHRKAEGLLLLIGRLQEDLPKDLHAAKELRPALQEIGKRLGKLTHDEELLLSEWRARRTAAPAEERRDPRRPARPAPREAAQMNERHVAEMERDVILLDDLLGRQRLEELLAITDEMAASRDRLRQLLGEYKKAKSDALRREIEREIRELERRLRELSEKAQRLVGEVPDEFVNSEALGHNDMQGRLDRLRDFLSRGEVDKALAELERLSQSLDSLTRGMEGDLRGFRRERFSAEERALSEIEDKLADLAHDEELLLKETETLKEQVSSRARQLVKDRAEPLARRLSEKVARLRKMVQDVEVGALGPWGSDELEKAQKRLGDLEGMLEQGDLDEARAMAQEAESSISRLIDELRGEEQASRFAQRAQLQKSRQRLEQARPLAREVIDEIGRALPRPDELFSPERRRLMQELRARQEALKRRGQELQKDLQRRTREIKDAPLLERMGQEIGEGLRKADGHMGRAEQELRQSSPRGAALAEGQAVDQLKQLRQQMQRARRPKDEGAGARLDREPVKIPGADEYRAPREFRQDILEAAKRESPAEFKDLVKRYYEELVK